MKPENLKPFDLEAAKRGERVVTRDGKEFTFGVHNPDASPSNRVIGWLDGLVTTYRDDGCYWNSGTECPHDLFMAPKKTVLFVVLCKDDGLYYTECYDSETDIPEDDHAITTLKIEIEE